MLKICFQISKAKHLKENQELPSEESKAVAEAEKMIITDLDEYCLEYIFDYLDGNDLISVSISSTTFQPAARIVFKRRFSALVSVQSSVFGLRCWFKGREIHEMQFQNLIPIFGDSISTIKMSYCHSIDKDYQKVYENIINRIIRHPLESLVKINFWYFPKGWLSIFSKPMPKVKSIYLEACDLSDKPVILDNCKSGARNMTLPEIFPKLHHLKIRCVYKAKHIGIITHFPYLKEVEIRNVYNCELPEIKSFLIINPQISSCVYDNGYNNNWAFVHFMAENTHFDKLKLLSQVSAKKPIHFKQIKHFIYSGDGYNFPFSFDQLENLELLCIRNMRIDDIIRQNEKLVNISLRITGNISTFLTNELAKLPAITFEIDDRNGWENWKDDIDALAKFLHEKTSSSNIKFKCSRNSTREYLGRKIATSWKHWNILKYV